MTGLHCGVAVRAVIAVATSACGTVLACAGAYAGLHAAFANFSAVAFSGPTESEPLEFLLLLATALCLSVAGGTLAARAAGVGWGRAVAVSVAGHAGGFLLSTLVLALLSIAASGGDPRDGSQLDRVDGVWASLAVAYAFVVSSIASLASLYGGCRNRLRGKMVLVLAAAAAVGIVLLLAENATAAIAASIVAWVSLPVAVVLTLSTDHC